MALKRINMDVLMLDENDQEQEYRVRIMLGDQLRAELEGKKLSLTAEHYMHTTALWAWAAMLREGHYDGPFQEFKTRCLEAATEKGDDEGELPDADPTPQAASNDSA